MNRNILLLLTLAGLASCAQEPESLSLWQIHSLRGNILPLNTESGKSGGIALMSGAFRQAQSPGALNVRAGVYNMYFGTPEAYFTDGAAVIDLMNRAGFDLLLVGVREFYFGPQTFADLAARADFPFISTNLRSRSGEFLPSVRPYWTSPGGKWVILNLTPATLLTQNLKSHVEGISLKDDVSALEEARFQLLQNQAAFRSVLFAGGYSFNPGTGPSPELMEILDHPLGQTVILGAAPASAEGVHLLVNSRGEGRTVISQNGSRLMGGQVLENLLVQPDRIPLVSALPLKEAVLEPDPEMGSPLAEIRRNLEKVMGEPVTRLESALTHVFDGESEVGNLMADLFRNYLGTEIFLLNSGTLRSDLSEGQLDKGGLYRLLPFGGNLGRTLIKGRDLLTVLKKSFSFIGRPEKGRGFLQISGLSVLWDPKDTLNWGLSPGTVTINGRMLDPDKSYSLGSTAYLLSGGDGYSELVPASGTFIEDPIPLLTLAIQELKKIPAVQNPPMGRYRIK